MIQRRALISGMLAAGALLFASGHTPYQQWAIYRRKHLLILSLRGDGSYPLAKQLAEHLAAILPESAARVTRAPDPERVASLLASGQIQVALLEPGLASTLSLQVETAGEAIPLTLLGMLGDYWLVAHEDFPANHAYRVVAALSQSDEPLSPAFRLAPLAGESLPTHAGVVAFIRGEPLPPAPELPPTPDDHNHRH